MNPQTTRITIDHPGAALATPAPNSGDTPPHSAAAPHRVSAFDLIAAQPWAITQEALATISAIARRENESVEAVEARLGRPLQNARAVTLRGSVAVVPVTGPVFRYANLMTEISGATSLEVLARDFNAALEDPAVSAIVLNIDSPGGQATGIAEFAHMVRAGSMRKPVVAYVDGAAASAAYWIASAAERVVMSKTAMVGSIGAVVAIDTNRAKAGVVEIVSAQSPKKRADVSTDEGRAQIQALIDAMAQVFVDDVAANRGVSVEKVLADFGQGDMRLGAAAVSLGMADRIGTLEELLAELNTPKTPTAKGQTTMNKAELQAAHPELAAELLADGAAAERARIADVEAQALPGHEALIAQFKADGVTTGPMAAVAILKAEREIATGRAVAIAADAPSPVPHAAAPTDAPAADGLPVEERAKAEWDASAQLRTEFASFDTYLAYAKAHSAGLVKVLSK